MEKEAKYKREAIGYVREQRSKVFKTADTIYLKKITAYAHLKYERRFLERQ